MYNYFDIVPLAELINTIGPNRPNMHNITINRESN